MGATWSLQMLSWGPCIVIIPSFARCPFTPGLRGTVVSKISCPNVFQMLLLWFSSFLPSAFIMFHVQYVLYLFCVPCPWHTCNVYYTVSWTWVLNVNYFVHSCLTICFNKIDTHTHTHTYIYIYMSYLIWKYSSFFFSPMTFRAHQDVVEAASYLCSNVCQWFLLSEPLFCLVEILWSLYQAGHHQHHDCWYELC